MKNNLFAKMCITLLGLSILMGCTRTASKTPIAGEGGQDEQAVEMPTKTFVVPKVVISTPSQEVQPTPTMKLFIPTATLENEGEIFSETPQATLDSEMVSTMEENGIVVPKTETVTISTPVANTTPLAVLSGFPGLPTIGILNVAQDSTISLLYESFPTKKSYTVFMNAYTEGCFEDVNDQKVGQYDSGAKESFTAIYKIPTALQGSSPITIRINIGDDAPFCFFFYNANYP